MSLFNSNYPPPPKPYLKYHQHMDLGIKFSTHKIRGGTHSNHSSWPGTVWDTGEFEFYINNEELLV